jgi:hypothetical protein
MSENYDKIIEMVDKYYYFIVSSKRVILLSSSDNLNEVKSKAIKKLEPNIEKFIGKKLIFVKIINTYDKFKDKEFNNLKLIGGPIAFEFMFGLIDNKKKIKNEKDSGNNKVYLSKKYIKENINDISKNLKKIVKKYLTNINTKTFTDIQVI